MKFKDIKNGDVVRYSHLKYKADIWPHGKNQFDRGYNVIEVFGEMEVLIERDKWEKVDDV